MLKVRPANQDPELRAAVEVLRTTILKAGKHEQQQAFSVIYCSRSDKFIFVNSEYILF